MESLVTIECRKFANQLQNWIYAFYPKGVYYNLILDSDNLIEVKIRMIISKEQFAKRASSIIKYIAKTFRYPQYIHVNYKYTRNLLDITVLCGERNQNIYSSENEK